MLSRFWDFLVRWRTRLFNLLGMVLLILSSPEAWGLVASVLGAPEVRGILPPQWLPWVAFASFAINLWMRPRVAVRARDAEAQK